MVYTAQNMITAFEIGTTMNDDNQRKTSEMDTSTAAFQEITSRIDRKY